MRLFHFFKKRKEHKNLEEVVNRYESTVLLDEQKSDILQVKKYLLERCESLANDTTDLVSAKKEYQSVTNYLTDIQVIETMDDQDRSKLTDIASSILSLEESRQSMQKKVGRLPDSRFNLLDRNKDEIPKAIMRLKENENTQYIMKKDLDYLDGEKVEWVYEKSELSRERELLRKISRIGVVLEFLVICTFMIFFFLELSTEASIALVVALGVALLLCFFLIRMQNLKVNQKKCTVNYNRAVKIQNSIKYRYINVTNAVDYSHEKFQVHDVKELEKDWQLYLEAVKEREKLSAADDELSYYRNNLVRLLRMYNLYDATVWQNQAIALVNSKEMVEVKHRLLERRQKIRTRIEKTTNEIRITKDEVMNISKEKNIFTPEMKGILDSVEYALQ